MTSSFHSCNGSHEPFLTKTMFDLTRQRCHKTVSALLLPFFGKFDPQICLQSYTWDHLGQRVGHHMSFNELEAKLQQIWNEMSQDIISNLYASMPDRFYMKSWLLPILSTSKFVLVIRGHSV
ncbi:hypothetical protein TNCV_4209071 [Trichonephila clavipes]|nr:hypothetical protein TNCV_4209071 [Trichonephila clavipes]